MILILTQCFPSRIGGVENLISNLSLSLSNSQKIIVFADSHHLTNDAQYDNLYKNRITVYRTGGIKFLRRRKKIKEVKNFIESNEVKLIIADSWKSLEIGIDYFNNKKIPTICLAHGNELLSSNPNKNKRINQTLIKTNNIISNSNYTKSLVSRVTKSHSNINVIYPGASDLRNLKENKINNINGDPILLTLARLEKRKGHLIIIKAIKELLNEFSNLTYLIAGNGPEEKSLKQFVQENNLQKNIIFLGNIDDSQKKYIFDKTDLMIMPTLDETKNNSIEGFGIAYIEAAFFSIPSIASNKGGTPEAVLDNVTGKIINNINELENSIRELITNKKLREKLGINAKQRAENELSWKIISDKYLSIIKSLTN